MSRQRLPTHNPSPSPAPILYPPSGPGPSGSGRASPFRPASSASQYSESPFGGGMSSNAGGGGGMGMGGYSGTAQQIEGQNDERLSGLLGKVKSLKDITVGIGNEVRDGNLELSGMNDTFASTGNFLGGTFRRMTKMANRQGGHWCWFMGFMLLVMWIFLVLWWWRR